MKPLANLVIGRSKTVFFGFVAIIVLSATLGLQVFALLTAGGYENPNSDSARVTTILKDTFKQSQPELVGILDFPRSADDPLSQTVGQSFASSLTAIKGVKSVVSYYSVPKMSNQAMAMKSTDGSAVYFFIDLDDKVNQSQLVGKIQDQFGSGYNDANVYFAGAVAITTEINHTISSDLQLAESFAVPAMIVLLLFVFGSMVAAGLPLLVGGLGILGSFVFLWFASQVSTTSVFAVNMITGMGLGLGIDYSLLMVNRYREERTAGKSVDDAVRTTVLTAGRTVLFSGVTVMIVIAALWFFPQGFLRSMAIGGVAVVLVCLGGALLALPGLLRMLGDRVNKGRVFKPKPQPEDQGFWADVARSVMAHPIRVAVVAILGLAGLASLAIGAKFGQVDDRILPRDNRVVAASNIIRDRFEGRQSSPVQILVKGGTDAEIAAYAKAISKDSRILNVSSAGRYFGHGAEFFPYSMPGMDPTKYSAGGWHLIVAIHNVESRSPDGLSLTQDLRAKASKSFSEVLIGGSAAVYTDSQLGVQDNLPSAIAWIAITTFILLFLFTGSLLLPLKAVVLNFLSLSATLGFLCWVFIGGNLTQVLGDFQVTGTIDTSTLVLIAVLTFGLSMDYELFLLSRIKDQHEAGLNTTESVAVGLQKSGRIITAAALVLAVSFIAFITSGVSIMKMMGIGISFAIILDATVVRALLVPALMRLFGNANWWAPKWAKKIADKVGFSH
jgi:RND superfamily putative drug exporter